MKKILSLCCLAFAFIAGSASAANIIPINTDPAGQGLNDPTPLAPAGGNPGVTIGEQRRIVYQFAADLWGAVLVSNADIRVQARITQVPGTQAVIRARFCAGFCSIRAVRAWCVTKFGCRGRHGLSRNERRCHRTGAGAAAAGLPACDQAFRQSRRALTRFRRSLQPAGDRVLPDRRVRRFAERLSRSAPAHAGAFRRLGGARPLPRT